MKDKRYKKEKKAWKLLMDLTDCGHNTPYFIHVGFHIFKID